MKAVGISTARRDWSRLLRQNEAADTIVITRQNRPVAKPVPPIEVAVAKADAAIASIHRGRVGVHLGGLSVQELIAEGRM